VTKPRGRPTETIKRDAGWSVIVDLLLAGGLNHAAFQGREHLLEEMERQLRGPDGKLKLGTTGIADIARQFLSKLPEGHPAKNTK
jgi:hypothetical protein